MTISLARFVVGSLQTASLLCGMLAAEQARAAPEDIVVMVEARHGQGKGQSFGAGLVVGRTIDRTVIVTARHVVANEAGDVASGACPEFCVRGIA